MSFVVDECEVSIIQVDEPWGWYKTIYSQHGFKVNHICVYSNKRISLQSHDHRSEHWVVVKGNSMVRIGNDELFLHANQNAFIPTRVLHRIENIGNENLEFIETQIGEYVEDSDVIIYEDDYSKKK